MVQIGNSWDILLKDEFHKDYYENANMPIRIITDTDRHTHFFKLSIKFTSYAMASDSLS